MTWRIINLYWISWDPWPRDPHMTHQGQWKTLMRCKEFPEGIGWRNLTQVLLSIFIKLVKNIVFFGVGRNHGIGYQICNEDPWGRISRFHGEVKKMLLYSIKSTLFMSRDMYFLYIFSVYKMYIFFCQKIPSNV